MCCMQLDLMSELNTVYIVCRSYMENAILFLQHDLGIERYNPSANFFITLAPNNFLQTVSHYVNDMLIPHTYTVVAYSHFFDIFDIFHISNLRKTIMTTKLNFNMFLLLDFLFLLRRC